jgi:glucose/mannose-6-phosphate isomerase
MISASTGTLISDQSALIKMIKDDIINFNKQFEYEPQIENAVDFRANFEDKHKFVICGMGGSGWPAELLKTIRPDLDVISWHDYGLPPIADNEYDNAIVVIVSYSGNTEEAISSFEKARDEHLPLIIVTAGGNLLELAVDSNTPYIQIPATGIQPRAATGYIMNAIIKILDEVALEDSYKLAKILKPSDFEKSGKDLAKRLKGKVPIIYTSNRNGPVARVWTIKFNETGKIPAFWNVIPEQNHNEMTGFDVIPTTEKFSKNFHFLILNDENDNPRILKRMEVLERLYEDRGLAVEIIKMDGQNHIHKVFSSLLLADWTAYHLSQIYGTEPEQVPMVEEFKELIQQ